MKSSRAAAIQAQAAQSVAERIAALEVKLDTLLLGTPALDQVPDIARFDAGICHLEGRTAQLDLRLDTIEASLAQLLDKVDQILARVAASAQTGRK